MAEHPSSVPHRVAVLALDDVSAFDLSTPIEVLGRTRLADGRPAYDVLIAGPAPVARAGPLQVTVPNGLDALMTAGTIVVPGRSNPEVPPSEEVLDALRDAAASGVRIVSICVGAYDLAATGLLDGLRSTVHWRHAGRLAARFPGVEVDGAALYVDNGQFLTSAGGAAGIDLCLHLVAKDFGGAVAAESARVSVVQLTRPAGQVQFVRDEEMGAGSITAVLEWIEQHAQEPIGVADIAAAAAMSVRTLNRRFAQEIGVSPGAWLIRSRVRRAQSLLTSTDWSMARIARDSGLGSHANLRARFQAVVGTSPSRYRAASKAAARGRRTVPPHGEARLRPVPDLRDRPRRRPEREATAEGRRTGA